MLTDWSQVNAVLPPLIAILKVAKGRAVVKSASSSNREADFPVNARLTRFIVSAPARAIVLPVCVEPVNEILATSGLVPSSSPTSPPRPSRMLKAPAGRPASCNASATTWVCSGLNSLGLMTDAQPAAIADASLLHIVPATLSDLNGETARVEIGTIDKRLRHRGAGAGAAKVAIRPESLRLSEARPNGPALEATLAKAAYLGTHMEYTVKTAIGDLFVVDRAVERSLPVGSPLFVTLAEHGVTVIPG